MEDASASIAKKLKPGQVLLFDEMDVQDEDPAEVLIGSEKVDMDGKGKTKIYYNGKLEGHKKDASASDVVNSVSVVGSMDSLDQVKSSTSGSINSNNLNSSNSDLSYHDGEDGDEDCNDYADDISDYDDNDDFLYEDEDDYLTMQSHFDNVDLPTGIEASIPWLKGPASTINMTSVPSTSTIVDPADSKKTTILDLADIKMQPASTNSQIDRTESSITGKEDDDIMHKFQSFKQFDIVDDLSDHHYYDLAFSGAKQPKEWAKRIHEEWKILEKDLPDTIFVRVCEARMDLLRAIIIGPSGTPYHDGLFVFDCVFPSKYPNEPPMVYYYSGGLRLNPNLYNCGKVCLSLLGTWPGQKTEMWVPGQSTMLQVLVSIQALILNANPFFNEPGYETSYVGADGERRSKKYNEDVFILSLKTMIYTLRRPPKHFEDFVVGHFRNRAHDILAACSEYADGATVGSVLIENGALDANKIEKGASNDFKPLVRKMMNLLARDFIKNGAIDCEKFQASRS